MNFERDPDKALWVPGRRGFLSMMGAALAGSLVPGWKPQPAECEWHYNRSTDTITFLTPRGEPVSVSFRTTRGLEWFISQNHWHAAYEDAAMSALLR